MRLAIYALGIRKSLYSQLAIVLEVLYFFPELFLGPIQVFPPGMKQFVVFHNDLLENEKFIFTTEILVVGSDLVCRDISLGSTSLCALFQARRFQRYMKYSTSFYENLYLCFTGRARRVV